MKGLILDDCKLKLKRKNAKKVNDIVTMDADLCPQASDDDIKLCSHTSIHTYGKLGFIKYI